MTLVVFVGTHERLTTLRRTVESFRQMTTPYEVRIVDNGSEDPRAVALLEELEGWPEVAKVYRLAKMATMQELTEHFNTAFRDTYKPGRDDWFAVTDADICFEGSDPASFDSYLRLAKATDCAVGPHLRVDAQISRGYPLRSRVILRESRLLYRRDMEWYDGIPFTRVPIDTTFHVFPATNDFKRLLMHTRRVGHPYTAMHLDWYVDFFHPTEEDLLHVPYGWSWGGSWILDYWLRFLESPEAAFEFMLHVPRVPGVCNTSFILSWAYQMGAGVGIDPQESRRWLRAAVPREWAEVFMLVESDWLRMIYGDDFSAMGWDA